MQKLDLTIGMVNYKTLDLISKAIESIKEKTKGISYEIVVVDNASRDGSAEVLKKIEGIKFIANSKNAGYPAAMNQAMKVADSRYFVAFNPDARLNNDALTEIIRFMDQKPRAGIATAQFYFPDGTPQRSYFGFIYPMKKAKKEIKSKFIEFRKLCAKDAKVNERYDQTFTIAKKVPTESQKIDCPLGACFMIKRKCMDEIGLMDDNIFIYADEVDYAWRAKKAGWDRYIVPSAKIEHDKAASTRKKADLMYIIHTQSNFYYAYKHFGLMGWLTMKFSFLIGGILSLILSMLNSLFRKNNYRELASEYMRDFKSSMYLFFLGKKVLPADAK